MKHTLLATIIALASPADAFSQSMESVLKSMPDSIAPLLTKNNVLDFIDYLASNMKAEVTNKLGGKSEMKELTPDYTLISMTGSSTYQMKLLTFGDDRIIALVHTVRADKYSDSTIRFYSKDWKHLPAGSFLTLNQEDEFRSLTLSAAATDLTVTYSNPLELDEKKTPRQSVILKWNGTRYSE